MLISKFNRLIRNKWIWTIIIAVIVFSFVFAALIDAYSSKENRKAGSIATIYGEEVTFNEVRQITSFLLRLNNISSPDSEVRDEVRKSALRIIAAARKARQVGYEIGDGELFGMVKTLPHLRNNDSFDPDMYTMNVGARFGMSVSQFEQSAKTLLLSEKMLSIAVASSWASPLEVQEEAASRTDRFSINIAELLGDTNEVELADEEIVAYFEANTNNFFEPERVSVAYTRFAFTNYSDKVTVADEDIELYYQNNLINEFTTKGTNGEDIVVARTNVEDQIIAKLKKSETQELAIEAASDLLYLMLPERTEKGKSFWNACNELGLGVSTTEPFTVNGWLPEIDAGTEFTTAAFGLDFDNRDSSYSDFIMSSDFLYIIAPVEKTDSYVPVLDDIRERVTSAAERERETELLNKKADDAMASLQSAISDGGIFSNAVAELSMNMITSVTFTAMGQPDFMYGYYVAPEVRALNAGDFADPIVVGDRAIIVQVEDRVPGDNWAFRSIGEQVRTELSDATARVIYRDWLDENLKNSGYTDQEEASISSDEEGEEEGEPESTEE